MGPKIGMDLRLQHEPKVHQRVSNRDRRQAATSGRKAYPGDKFPTAQSSGPPRDRAKKGLEICTPEMWELTAPG